MAESLQETLRQGRTAQQAGNLPEAERLYRQVLAIQPNEPTALHLMGILALQVNQPAIAIDLIRRALVAGQPTADAFLNLGLAHTSLSQTEAAREAFGRAAQLATHLHHWQGIGRGLIELNLPADAEAAFRSAALLAPDDPATLGQLGRLLVLTHRAADAVPILQKALARDPNNLDIHRDLGMALVFLGQASQAEHHLRIALKQWSGDAFVINALGTALARQNRATEAAECFQRAIDLLPPDKATTLPSLHWNLGRMLLLQGDFLRGWRESEWRFDDPSLGLNRDFSQPRWSGENLAGKTLLLHAVGGHGDTIQFIRFIPQIIQRGGTVILECQPALVRLLADISGISRVLARGSELPHFDFHFPLVSAPVLLETTLQSLPASVPYLRAPIEQLNKWQERLATNSQFKVGLVWRGSTMAFDFRTSSLAAFKPLALVKGVSSYGLQKGAPATEAPPTGMQLIRLDPEIHDFADLAAVMMNMDLVITVDTAAAHLAGALGKPVWVLITYNPDFRWMLDREDSPWYPTMRLFRQSAPDSWADVFEQIRAELRKRVAK